MDSFAVWQFLFLASLPSRLDVLGVACDDLLKLLVGEGLLVEFDEPLGLLVGEPAGEELHQAPVLESGFVALADFSDGLSALLRGKGSVAEHGDCAGKHRFPFVG